ncbi:winged helix-turn-helix domain-containing protein, partial [Enterococcus sp. RTP21361st1_A6_RTP21361_211029]
MTAYTRTEHLRHELASQIRNGTLKPGNRIMSETRLAEEYQVSRGTVRRALEQLKKAELIETRMGSGSYVAFNGGSMSGPDGWTSASLRSG